MNHSPHVNSGAFIRTDLPQGDWIYVRVETSCRVQPGRHHDLINGWIHGKGRFAGSYKEDACSRRGVAPGPRMLGLIHSCPSVTTRHHPRHLSLPFSWPVAALLSSERRLGKCRTSSAELSLHSCWCQLLCPPSLLSPSPRVRSPSHKLAAATCWLLLKKNKTKKKTGPLFILIPHRC